MPAPTPPNLSLTSTFVYDALILGTGPAGLSAALALARANRPVAIFGTSVYRNTPAHRAHNVLGHDHIPPSQIRARGRADVEKYGTANFVERAVTSARQLETDGLYEVTDDVGEEWRGKKVVLAMGVKDVYPEIDGYAECWGKDVYQCLFCDGLERSDRPVGMLGFTHPMNLHNVAMMFQLGCPSVTIFANGKLDVTDATGPALEKARLLGATIDERKIAKLVHLDGEEGMEIHFEDGSTTRVGFLAHMPPTVVNAPEIVEALGVEIISDGIGNGTYMRRNEPLGETNVKGVFAAGDSGSPMIKAVALSMAQGAAAGGGVNFSIIGDELEHIGRK